VKTIIRLIVLLALSTGVCFGQQPAGPSSSAGRYTVSEYGNWQLHSMNNVGAASQTVYVDNCYPSLGTNKHPFFPLATNAPITINDGEMEGVENEAK
jgi:hypothetical protein